jgi:SNF2 family DNA or RNA helicase
VSLKSPEEIPLNRNPKDKARVIIDDCEICSHPYLILEVISLYLDSVCVCETYESQCWSSDKTREEDGIGNACLVSCWQTLPSIDTLFGGTRDGTEDLIFALYHLSYIPILLLLVCFVLFFSDRGLCFCQASLRPWSSYLCLPIILTFKKKIP